MKQFIRTFVSDELLLPFIYKILDTTPINYHVDCNKDGGIGVFSNRYYHFYANPEGLFLHVVDDSDLRYKVPDNLLVPLRILLEAVSIDEQLRNL